MSPDRPGAPGWYPDPADDTRMRRWDGNQWTGDSRERPPWAPPGAIAREVATRKPRGKHWLALLVAAMILFVGVSYKGLTAKPDLPDRSIFDAQFIAAANDTCRDEIVALKSERPRPGSREGRDPGSHDDVARTVEDVAKRLDAIADRLRRLPVLAEDEADVAGWLADWDRYIALGHDYAAAVREDHRRQGDIAEEGVATARRATLFAEANKLDACMFA